MRSVLGMSFFFFFFFFPSCSSTLSTPLCLDQDQSVISFFAHSFPFFPSSVHCHSAKVGGAGEKKIPPLRIFLARRITNCAPVFEICLQGESAGIGCWYSAHTCIQGGEPQLEKVGPLW